MRFSSCISENEVPDKAIDEICTSCLSQLGSDKPDLALLFISSRYTSDWTSLIEKIHIALGQPILMGCTGEGIIGHNKELEFMPGMALISAHLPNTNLQPFYISQEELDYSSSGDYWVKKTKCRVEDKPSFILIPDPFTCNAIKLLNELNETFPASSMIGGLASGGAFDSEQNMIFLQNKIFRNGAVGLALTGNIHIETIVSQGCKPIGDHLKVTKAEGNYIYEINETPVHDILLNIVSNLSEEEQILAQNALFIGLAVDEKNSLTGKGNFLVRNIMSYDQKTGSLAIGDQIQVGQTIQFQLRDAKTAEDDLRVLLELNRMMWGKNNPRGALLFSCLGRGKGLFGESDHDIGIIKNITGEYPIAGFFCNGEIGPIGGKNFIHGYTSSLGIFFEQDSLKTT